MKLHEHEKHSEMMNRIAIAAQSIEGAIADLGHVQYTQAACVDEDTGRHVAALEAHLDSARGRLSTLVHHLRALGRR